MKIYIDNDFKCHTSDDGTMREIETDFFDGKSKLVIGTYRFIPYGETWTRFDGMVFTGEMITPWIDYDVFVECQNIYEETTNELQDELADKTAALELLLGSEVIE